MQFTGSFPAKVVPTPAIASECTIIGVANRSTETHCLVRVAVDVEVLIVPIFVSVGPLHPSGI